jgi:hypothetical protein
MSVSPDCYRNQLHIYQPLNLAYEVEVDEKKVFVIDNVTNRSINANVPFPVKEVRFNFSYLITADVMPLLLVECSLVNWNVVGCLNNFATLDGSNEVVLTDNFKQQNNFSFIFKDPLTVQGSIDFRFENNIGVLSVARIIAHIEFLGY